MQTYNWLSQGENIIYETKANKQLNIKGINLPVNKGGKLILTNKHLVFQAHTFNLGTNLDKIPLENITNVEKGFHPLVPTPNMIKIETRLSEKYMFIVTGKDMEKWLKIISKAMNECSVTPKDDLITSKTTNNEYKCMSCGYVAQRPYKFCPECGAAVNMERRCPGCGVIVEEGQKFCSACGQSLME